jgi:hypothetical protein
MRRRRTRPKACGLRSTTNLTQSRIYQIQNANLGALAKDKVWLSCYDRLAAARAGRCRLAGKAGRDWRALTVAGTGVNLSARAKPNSQERPLRK